MNVVLVNPGTTRQTHGVMSYNVGVEPPYFLLQNAAYLENSGSEVAVIDAAADGLSPEQVGEMVVEYQPRVVEIYCMGITPSTSSTPKMPAALAVSHEIAQRCPNTTIDFYGIHPMALPAETRRESGLKCHIGPSTLPAYIRPERPAWHLIDLNKYRCHNWHGWGQPSRSPYASLYTSFGCPFRCTFCTIHVLYGGYRREELPVDTVLKQIDYLHERGVRNIKFADEIFALKETRTVELCNRIASRGYDLNIWAFCRVDTMTPRMAHAMVRAGIRGHAYGIESGTEAGRRSISKRVTDEQVYKAIETSRREGAIISGDFIFGVPEDDMESMKATLDMAMRILPEHANFYCACAYPGSQLYNEVDKSLLPETWGAYSQYSPKFRPLPTKYLSSKEVLTFRDGAFEAYYGSTPYQEMIQRKFGPKAVGEIREILSHKLERV